MHSLRMWCKILCQNLVVHPKCTLGGSTKFHPSMYMLSVGGWGGFAEFDVEFKFAKIQNSYVEGGWVGGVAEFDVEFKFAKIQNSYVEGGWVGGGFVEFDAEFKFAKIQSFYFHEPPLPPPRKWKFQFRTGLRKLFEVDF